MDSSTAVAATPRLCHFDDKRQDYSIMIMVDGNFSSNNGCKKNEIMKFKGLKTERILEGKT